MIEHGPKECCIGERTLIKNKTIKKYGKATAYITLLGMFSGYYWYQNDEINTYDCCGSGSTLMHDRTTKNTFPEKNTYGPFIWALFELTDEVREREWSCPSITVSLSELKPVGLGK